MTWPTAMPWGCCDRAPTPDQGARLSLSKIQSALKRGGRQRNIAARAREIQAVLRTEQLRRPRPGGRGVRGHHPRHGGHHRRANRQIASWKPPWPTHFETHPDADIYRSLPGLGVVLGARVLGEFGDDPNRYTTPSVAKTTPEHHR